jgi:tetratricopeptide (TPR) repeat protein
MLRCACVVMVLSFAGCQSLPTSGIDSPRAAAVHLWAEGQAKMQDGRHDEAITDYERSLAVQPARPQSLLSLAAAELEKGDEVAACRHLAQYVAARPQDLKVRAYYAELLLRLRLAPAAREEFERYDADAQDQGPSAAKQLIHCHSRLTKIATEQEDEYAEHLHRGIGLYLLGQARAQLPDPEGELPAEGLFCKAATELTHARLQRPDEARPWWYLYEVWSRLGQTQPAKHSLAAATDAAPFSYLTPAEKRSLQLATHVEERPRN